MDIRYLAVDLRFVCEDPAEDTDENFDAFTDAVMDALTELEDVDSGIVDPDITARITERTLSVLMGIDADTERDAVRLFSANVRTALHAAECTTADWPVFKQANTAPKVAPVDFSRA
ncbi:hypothetical protein LUW76_46970 [Actinomadura madurae]|uniref:hypothetical protein n=1 Tax=Actinomadura madurae TaxID=1993 RepID=UPI002026E456|nr:hypothetical protein [Actinomadura madurae]URN01243.1 hypothetical protein LUW76_46970 [Actinomadura madurae]